MTHWLKPAWLFGRKKRKGIPDADITGTGSDDAASPYPPARLVDPDGLTRLIGATPENLELYVLALTHRSLHRGRPEAHLESNERLEYLGDAVLGFVVAERLFQTFEDRTEGFMTRLRAKLVNGTMLASMAREIGLESHILMSDNLAEQGALSNSVLSDAFEALIGAVYLDRGMEAARWFIDHTLLSRVNLRELGEARDDYKSTLLEAMQASSRRQPVYRIVSESGPSHEKEFTVAVFLEGIEYGRGTARNKKSAEKTAAAAALRRLREEESAS